jgi:hypothetical protein
MSTLITSVVGALLVAAILGIAKSRWLYLVIPKLVFSTPLSTGGRVVSLQLTNAGFHAEEEIHVRLKPTCRYEFLAGSDSTLKFADNTLQLSRLSRGKSVTALLLVEGKTFEPSDVEAVESKATSGKVVHSKEQINSPWQHLVVWPLVLLFMAAPFVVGTFVGKESGHSAFESIAIALDSFRASKQLAGYKVVTKELYPSLAGNLKNVVESGRVVLKTIEVVRRGEILYATCEVANNLSETLVFEVETSSSAGDSGPLSYYETRSSKTYVTPSSKKSVTVRAFLPEDTVPKIVVLRYEFSIRGDSNTVEQTMTFD